MTYDRYYSSWNRHHLSDAEKAEQLADSRRRANSNLMNIRAKASMTINHKAGM